MITRSQNRRVRGQSAVMVAFLTMIVVMLIAFTTNLGKLVTEKIAMQNAVDMAVYSGAATQAGYMNKLREINQDIWKAHDDARSQLDDSEGTVGDIRFLAQPPTTPLCLTPGPDMFPGSFGKAPIAETAIILRYKGEIARKTFDFTRMNLEAPGKVREATEDAADANYSGTKSKLRIKNVQNMGGLIPSTQKPVQWSYKSWVFIACPCICPTNGQMVGSRMTERTTANSWFMRRNVAGEIHVAAGIENATPNSNFLDGTYLGQFFGGNCRYGGGGSGRCAMSTYAAAHPHQGKLGSIHPDEGGSALWERMWETPAGLKQIPFRVDQQSALRDHEPFRRHYYDYKVRFVGIFESDMESLGGAPIAPLMGTYGTRMEH